MGKHTSHIGNAIETNNNREVAAIITFIKTPTIKADFNTGSGLMAALLQKIENAPGLVVRRPWFGFDKTHLDDFSERVPRHSFDPAEINTVFNTIRRNPQHGFYAGNAQEEADDIQAELNTPRATLTDIDLTQTQNPAVTIQMQVPFLRLQKFLTRAYQATEENGTAHMTHIRVASAPRFDNDQPRLGAFFSLE